LRTRSGLGVVHHLHIARRRYAPGLFHCCDQRRVELVRSDLGGEGGVADVRLLGPDLGGIEPEHESGKLDGVLVQGVKDGVRTGIECIRSADLARPVVVYMDGADDGPTNVVHVEDGRVGIEAGGVELV